MPEKLELLHGLHMPEKLGLLHGLQMPEKLDVSTYTAVGTHFVFIIFTFTCF
jgi:hypothetical protein